MIKEHDGNVIRKISKMRLDREDLHTSAEAFGEHQKNKNKSRIAKMTHTIYDK